MLSPEAADVLAFLSEHGGAEQFFTANTIACRCGLPAVGTCSEVRDIIRTLNELGHPIVSSKDGFCYTHDEEKLYAYREHLWSRAEAIIVRAHNITNIIRSVQNVTA